MELQADESSDVDGQKWACILIKLINNVVDHCNVCAAFWTVRHNFVWLRPAENKVGAVCYECSVRKYVADSDA